MQLECKQHPHASLWRQKMFRHGLAAGWEFGVHTRQGGKETANRETVSSLA